MLTIKTIHTITFVLNLFNLFVYKVVSSCKRLYFIAKQMLYCGEARRHIPEASIPSFGTIRESWMKTELSDVWECQGH